MDDKCGEHATPLFSIEKRTNSSPIGE